jgi:hypothetical protein
MEKYDESSLDIEPLGRKEYFERIENDPYYSRELADHPGLRGQVEGDRLYSHFQNRKLQDSLFEFSKIRIGLYPDFERARYALLLGVPEDEEVHEVFLEHWKERLEYLESRLDWLDENHFDKDFELKEAARLMGEIRRETRSILSEIRANLGRISQLKREDEGLLHRCQALYQDAKERALLALLSQRFS